MHRLTSLLARFAPLFALVAGMVAVPAAGAGHRSSPSPAPQGTGTGRASGQTTQTGPPTGHAIGQRPPMPPPGQAVPRPTPNAEQFLGWEWWKDESVKSAMKLTDSQVRSITQIFDRRVREVTPFYEEYRKRMADLDRLTQERTVDEQTFAVQVVQAEALRSQLNETRTVMLYTIYRRLDPAQYEKLREIRDQRFRRGGGVPGPRSW